MAEGERERRRSEEAINLCRRWQPPAATAAPLLQKFVHDQFMS